MIPIIDKLAGLLDYKARYTEEVRENFTLTEQNINLRKQLDASKQQVQRMMVQHDDALARLKEQHQEEITALIADYAEKIADLDKQLKVAKYHGKKKPTTTETVTPAQS